MEKKHDLVFCPQCGVKLDGDEIICTVCGYKLAENHPVTNLVSPVPPPPIIESAPETPPVIDTHPVVPPVIEVTPAPVQKPAVSFCPNCGAKIDLNEIFCNGCGFRLSDINAPKSIDTVIHPIIVPPIVTPPVQNIPPAQQPYQQQPQMFYPTQPPKKKAMGVGWWILIIFLIVIILGGGTVAFLQYNGNIDIEVLRDYIPSKNNQSATAKTEDPTRYYVVHSFAVVGTKWNAIISDVVVSRQKFNNEEGAKNQFKIAIQNKYPKDYHNFYNNVMATQYMTYPEAQSAHSSLLKTYGTDPKNYTVKTIKFGY